MRLLSQAGDIIFFLFCGFRAFINFKERSNYSTCVAPIQIFLIAAPLTIMIMMIIFHLFNISLFIPRLRKYLDFLTIFILTPFCFYLLVQGAIWQVSIQQKSPSCPTGISETPWIWAFLLFCCEMVFGHMTFFIGREYWLMYQMRRRIRMMNELVENGDYERFNQIVLELGSIENNKIGLLSADIERLEKADYQPDFQREDKDNEENCAICLVEFNKEDKVITLPKCEHIFHSECVKDWLKKKPLCPMCRGNVRKGMVDFEMQVINNWYRPLPEATGNPR